MPPFFTFGETKQKKTLGTSGHVLNHPTAGFGKMT
jgi:hypothetical protein